MADLDAAILAAHATGDGRALALLYSRAADTADTPEAAAFFLTHAWVWALATGSAETDRLHARLAREGRV